MMSFILAWANPRRENTIAPASSRRARVSSARFCMLSSGGRGGAWSIVRCSKRIRSGLSVCFITGRVHGQLEGVMMTAGSESELQSKVRDLALALAASGVRVIRPEDDGYASARSMWNAMIERRPCAVVRCQSAEQVALVVRACTRAQLPMTVRGGGHSVAGQSIADSAVLLDLSGLRAVHVDPTARRARVGGGALWSDVDSATAAHELAVTGGVVSHTGVGGLTLG